MRIVGGATPSPDDYHRPAGLSIEQYENARTIAQVGRELGVGSRGIQVALMTALMESGLRNLSYGDRDSVGVFQQRNAWGSYAKRMNVAESARMFFTGGEEGQRGLLDIPHWDQLDPAKAAQAVQVSASGNYGPFLGKAQQILEGLHDAAIPVTAQGTPRGQAPSGATGPIGAAGDQYIPSAATLPMTAAQTGLTAPAAPPVALGAQDTTSAPQDSPGGPLTSAYDKLIEQSPQATGEALGANEATALGTQASNETQDTSEFLPNPDYTLSDLAIPAEHSIYQYKGAPPDAQVTGVRSQVLNLAHSLLGTPYVFGGNSPSQGLDCSGLIKYVLEKAGIQGVPRLSGRQAQWAGGYNQKANDLTGARPGDLITWGDGPDGSIMDHIAFYVGNGKILEEPRTGLSARIIDIGKYYRNLYGGFHIVHMGKVYGD